MLKKKPKKTHLSKKKIQKFKIKKNYILNFGSKSLWALFSWIWDQLRMV